MAERKRSKDGSRDTEKVFGPKGEIDHEGRSDGTLQRRVGTRDELKRATERPAGKTRVTKGDEHDPRDT